MASAAYGPVLTDWAVWWEVMTELRHSIMTVLILSGPTCSFVIQSSDSLLHAAKTIETSALGWKNGRYFRTQPSGPRNDPLFSHNHDSGSARRNPYQPAKWRLCVADPTVYHPDSSEVMQQAVRSGTARHDTPALLPYCFPLSHTGHFWSMWQRHEIRALRAMVRNVFCAIAARSGGFLPRRKAGTKRAQRDAHSPLWGAGFVCA